MQNRTSLGKWSLLLCLSFCSHQCFPAECSRAAITGCASFIKQVEEVPLGRLDGRNTQFILTKVPLPGTPVVLTINDRSLDPGVAYRIDGQIITTSTNNIPKQGDVLRAVYQTIAPNIGPPSAVRAVAAPLQQMSLADDTLLEAVRRETVPVETAGPHGAPGGRDAVGVEGLGDSLVASPFESRSETSSEGRNGARRGTVSSQTDTNAGESTALLMLQRRMDAVEEQQLAPLTKKKKKGRR